MSDDDHVVFDTLADQALQSLQHLAFKNRKSARGICRFEQRSFEFFSGRMARLSAEKHCEIVDRSINVFG